MISVTDFMYSLAEPQVTAFDVLMGYYSKLHDQMNLIDADELRDRFYSVELITHSDRISIQRKHIPDLILTRLASYLLSGETHLFCKVLGVLHCYEHVAICGIAVEIQTVLNRLFGM